MRCQQTHPSRLFSAIKVGSRAVTQKKIWPQGKDSLFQKTKEKEEKMNKDNFPVEFNNEIDDVMKSENEYYTLAVDRLSKLAEGHNDISGAAVNLKQPAQGRQTAHVYEVTIIVYMGSDHIAATEMGEQFKSTLDGALDAVERQVRERRTKQRNY
jgi:ribosome-associated translation inhibitor RaiA